MNLIGSEWIPIRNFYQGVVRVARLGDLGSAFGAEKPSVATCWLIGDLFSRILCFWRVFRNDLATIKRSLKCSMYIAPIAPCTWRQGKRVENRFIRIIDCLKIDNYRKSVWSIRYLTASATFFSLFRLGPIVKLATFGDFPDLFWRLAAPNIWQRWP